MNININQQEQSFSDYQHYLMMLEELSYQTNKEKLHQFLEWLMKEESISLDINTTPLELSKIDTAIFKNRKQALENIAPEIKANIDDRISSKNPIEMLIDAKYDVMNIPVGIITDLQTTMAFEETFPDINKKPLIERLKSAKEHVSNLMKNDKNKLMLSAVMFSVAVGTGGGAGLAISTAMFATKMIENKFVQGMLSRFERGVDDFLINKGFKKENVEERKTTIGQKLADITESDWYKKLKVPVTAAVLLTGVGSLAYLSANHLHDAVDLVTNADIPSIMNKVYENTSSGLNIASEYIENTSVSDVAGDAYDYASSGFKTILNSIQDGSLFEHANLNAKSMELDNYVLIENGNPMEPDLVSNFSQDFFSLFNNNELDTGVVFSGQGEGADLLSSHVDMNSTSYTATSDKNTLWELAKDHYSKITGNIPSDQQIVAMINDLNIADPNHIQIGQEFNFDNDVSKYKDITHVQAEWLSGENQVIPKDNTATNRFINKITTKLNLEPSP